MVKGSPSLNPNGRAGKKGLIKRIREDGWSSLLTGVGTVTYDKRVQQDFCADVVDYQLAQELWRGDDIAARTIDLPADEMTRAWYDVSIQDESVSDHKQLQEEVEAYWKELGVREAFLQALQFEAAYGGAAILIGAKDFEEDLSKPLVKERVQSVDFLTVLESRNLVPAYYYANPRAPKYGKPALYQLSHPSYGGAALEMANEASTTLIHESRLLVFPGVRVSNADLPGTSGWGDSKLTRLWRVLRDFNIAWDGTGILVSDFAQAVFKMEGLAEMVAQDNLEAFANRMRALELGRSTARAALIDSSEDFERKQTPVNGLAELLREYMPRLASAAGMPVTVLFGVSPAGLSATGESDIRLWYDRIASDQQKKVTPNLTYLTSLLLAAMGHTDLDTWSVDARPLWQPTLKETAETRSIQAETDTKYIQAGVLFPEEVAMSRFGGDAYSIETQVDFEGREEAEKLLAEEPPEEDAGLGEEEPLEGPPEEDLEGRDDESK